MRLFNNKKFKNIRLSKEKYEARHKNENIIGVPTGFIDTTNRPILSGDKVLVVEGNGNLRECIVLWSHEHNCYCTFYGFSKNNIFDARNYGKIDELLDNKTPKKISTLKVI